MLVVSGHGASAELAVVTPLPCQRAAEPAFPAARPGGSSRVFPAGRESKTQLCGAVEEQLMCRSAVGLPVLWLLLWVVLHLEMLLFPCGLQKMLWRKFCQRRPPAGEELWVLEQQEWCSPPPPLGGLTDPLTWSSMWGSSWGPQPPALCVGESLPPPPA